MQSILLVSLPSQMMMSMMTMMVLKYLLSVTVMTGETNVTRDAFWLLISHIAPHRNDHHDAPLHSDPHQFHHEILRPFNDQEINPHRPGDGPSTLIVVSNCWDSINVKFLFMENWQNDLVSEKQFNVFSWPLPCSFRFRNVITSSQNFTICEMSLITE